MKTKYFTISFLLLLIAPNLKAQDTYGRKIDTLLVSIGKLILNDLSNDSIKVLKRPWIGFGDSFELEVVFNAKKSVILTYLNRTEELKEKCHKTKLKHQFKYKMFMNYIHDHNELPYGTFDSFSYKFLLLQTKGEALGGEALFGEYTFKAGSEGLTIIDKRIGTLKGEKAILEKHGSDW